MINIVVVAHGHLAEALIGAAEMIAGPQESLFAVALLPEESPDMLKDKLATALQGTQGEETLVLVDLFGGTPYNVAVSQLLRREGVECVTGVNLPMLLGLVMSRSDSVPAELAESITQSGQEAIKNLGPLLKRRS